MDVTQHGCYFKAELSVIVKGEKDPRKDKMQAFHPNLGFSRILVKAAFLLGLLNPSVQGPYRRQSETGRPQHCSSQPVGLYEGGIREASACVAAIVYQETRGRLNNPPVNTAIQWETRKWQDPRDLRTHMPFPWSWRIDLVLFGRLEEEERGTGRRACSQRQLISEWIQEKGGDVWKTFMG